MTEADREPFAAKLAALAEVFNEPMSEARLEGYWLAVAKRMTFAAFERAVQSALEGSKFFPRPSELLDLAGMGKPDALQIEAMIVQHLRRPEYPPSVPADPFLRLVFERLGGVWSASGMAARDRVRMLEHATPGIVAAATARGTALPNEVPDVPLLRREVYALPEPE